MRARGKKAFTALRAKHTFASAITRGKKMTVGNMVFHYRTGHKNAPFHLIPERVVADIIKTSGKICDFQNNA